MKRQLIFMGLLAFVFSISAYAQDMATVTAKQVNIRVLPTVKGKVAATVKQGTILSASVLDLQGDWFPVVYGKITGWVHKSGVRFKQDSFAEVIRTAPKGPPKNSINPITEFAKEYVKNTPPAPPVTPPQPREWELLTGTKTDEGTWKTAYLFRPNSIVNLYGRVYKVWAKEVTVKAGDEKGYSTVELFEINCPLRRYRITRIISYDAKKNILNDDDNGNSAFEDAVPSSIGEYLVTEVCARVSK